MTTSTGKSGRSLPGEALYNEHSARFGRLVFEKPLQGADEYGFTFLHSVDESAATMFLKSLSLIGDTWRERFLLAVGSHRRGQLDEAEKQYKALLDDAKGNKEVEYNLAALYLHRGDAAQARKRLEVFEKWLAELEKEEQIGEALAFLTDAKEHAAELRAELEQH